MGQTPVYPQPIAAPAGAVPMAPAPQQAYQASAAPESMPEVPEEAEEDEYDEVWIAKAKEIVDQTREDPYRQSRAISKIKSDYLKARYDKTIKVAEDSNT